MSRKLLVFGAVLGAFSAHAAVNLIENGEFLVTIKDPAGVEQPGTDAWFARPQDKTSLTDPVTWGDNGSTPAYRTVAGTAANIAGTTTLAGWSTATIGGDGLILQNNNAFVDNDGDNLNTQLAIRYGGVNGATFSQTISAASLAANTTYQLSVDIGAKTSTGAAQTSEGWTDFRDLLILSVGGDAMDFSGMEDPGFTYDGSLATTFTYDYTTGDTVSDLEITIGNSAIPLGSGNSVNNAEAFGYDNVSFAAIPEPGTLSLIALLGGGLIGIRRVFMV